MEKLSPQHWIDLFSSHGTDTEVMSLNVEMTVGHACAPRAGWRRRPLALSARFAEGAAVHARAALPQGVRPVSCVSSVMETVNDWRG